MTAPARKPVNFMNREELEDELLIARARLDALDARPGPVAELAAEIGLSAGNECSLFALLHARLGIPCTKSAIMDWVYAAELDAPDQKIVDVYICKIRRKMREARERGVDVPYEIETVWGQGYRLVRLEPQEAAA